MESTTEIDVATNDLGPLAWVLDELRKSLESASAALRRFVRDTALARGQDMASVDGGQLRIARQQLHQAVGALEMVGLGAPAHMLRSMESAVQRFIEQPELCTETAAAKVERAGYALAEYLEGVLLGKPASAVGLFPQYRDTQELAGADRVHPADLWSLDWRWNDPQTPPSREAIIYDPAVRSRMDQGVLKLVKTGDVEAAADLAAVTLSLSATQSARQPKIFWKICAAYFEALAIGLLPLDLYVKRAASRILQQYASLAKGEQGVSDRLAHDLVFFCSQAVPRPGDESPCLDAVRHAWSLGRFVPVDYHATQYGRFDPVLLAQARKRITSAKETWSSLSGGDANKLKSVVDQFHLVSDSLLKLHPPSGPLAQALTNVVEGIARTARPPGAEVAMEVATAVLYLEAAFQDLDPNDPQLAVRTARLAERLDQVRQGGQPEPLESWMEELYRRVSDRQTMGSVVGELRGTLGELEKLLDQYFRNLQDKTPLRDAPAHLAQMRGVLSVLGLDQAAQAVGRMREAVEEIIVTQVNEAQARSAGTFDKLGNNLGALGFLIDMLNYQPALAKKLFVYDDSTGELRPLMGRTGDADQTPGVQPEPVEQASAPVLEPLPEAAFGELAQALDGFDLPAASAAPEATKEHPTVAMQAAAATPAAAPEPDIEEDDLLDIFLEEAREVVQTGLSALDALAVNPADLGELTTLRRAFHTLKGSSRMVGLDEYGEAAWSLEQLINTWLADQKHATDELRVLARDAMRGFGRWTEDIARHDDAMWKAGVFRAPADALRVDNKLVAFDFPVAMSGFGDLGAAPQEPVEIEAVDIEDAVQEIDLPVVASEVQAVDTDAADAPVFELPEVAQDVDETIELDAPALPEFEPAGFDSTQIIRPALTEPAPPVEVSVEALGADFDFDFEADPVPVPAALVTELPSEIDGIDFDSLAAVAGPAALQPSASVEADEQFAAEAAHPDLEPPDEVDEQVKVIGSLRIGIPLYNVYLNEADEWSRRLANEVSEWALELDQPVPDSTVGLAHALAGSSATVGFHALSDIARALEDSLAHAQTLAYCTPAHGAAFTDAAEEIRRLLHQFAAGFLKEPAFGIVESLQALGELDIAKRDDAPDSAMPAMPGMSGFGDLDFAAQEPAVAPQPIAVTVPDTVPEAVEAVAQPMFESPAEPVIEPLSEPAGEEISLEAPLIEEFVFEEPAAQAPIRPIEPIEPMVSSRSFEPVPVFQPVSDVPEAARRTVVALNDDDDDIDVEDALDPDLFPIFEEEAIELMPQLGGALRQWSARPDNRSARDEALRALHTLKGSARLAGALRLGELAHRMESEIEYLGMDAVSTENIEPILQRHDSMQATFETLRVTGLAGIANAADAVAPTLYEQPVAEPESLAAAQDAFAESAQQQPQPMARALIARPVTTNIAPQRAAANQAVRVRSQLLDRLVNQAGEVMITRSRLEAELRQLRSSLTDLTGNLDRLRAQLRDIELQAESQMQSRLAQAKDSAAGFDPLEFDRFTRVQELTRMMAESVNDVATVQRNLQRTVESTEDDLIAQARQTRELQRDLLRTRMVEFEGISERLYRVIRLASKETGKQVKLDITGGSIEMDRGVLDRMTPAFEHLLRNCVAHGIEDPVARTAAGKDAAGTILIGLHHEGNDVSVEFRDDGAGLNVPRIRDKALQQGLITADQELSDQEAANLIFMPGFSTATEITELSGRGIGMDVVRAEVNALGGRIETTTKSGQGTSFKLVLPLTTAVTQVVMIRTGKLSIGVPANVVEVVRRATPKELEQAYATGTYDVGGEKVPFYWSGALLQSSTRSLEPQGRTLPVVVFRSAAQRVAMHVDEVLGNQEVVVKNLGPQLARLPGLAGMTVLASGAVVLIYNPVALTTVYGDQARTMSADAAQPESLDAGGAVETPAEPVPVAPQIPLVLVVDDSITVRRVTQRLLQREGYRVAMAADGLQALERLAEEKPTVVLSDIEMPRMDGFDLARNIRGDQRLKDLPIIMITSRIAEKHREHARELGVDHYLGKPYSEEELLSLVKHYCNAAALA
ncbi:Hpt domain-containing protein [Caenimonas sp. SL110]|uniref:Hpt domain-containing protein n=1 Tax=Caenimonas sp. SL110 TaxID=1450524 RepID=UPI000653A8CE|nr:Hpt domain-containing protein [Caenimonas sp. SL110]